jgi:excisionase family DNA binding protein
VRQHAERKGSAVRVREVAARLEISQSNVYALIKEGKLRCTRHGLGRGCIRVSEEQLAEYLRDSTQAAPASTLRWIR